MEFGDNAAIVCFHCRKAYVGRPEHHVCSDGTTHSVRVAKLGGTPVIYSPYDSLNLTEEDRKFLKGIKVKP